MWLLLWILEGGLLIGILDSWINKIMQRIIRFKQIYNKIENDDSFCWWAQIKASLELPPQTKERFNFISVPGPDATSSKRLCTPTPKQYSQPSLNNLWIYSSYAISINNTRSYLRLLRLLIFAISSISSRKIWNDGWTNESYFFQ